MTQVANRIVVIDKGMDGKGDVIETSFSGLGGIK